MTVSHRLRSVVGGLSAADGVPVVGAVPRAGHTPRLAARPVRPAHSAHPAQPGYPVRPARPGHPVRPRRGTRRGPVAPVEVEVAVLLDLLDAACAAGCSVPGALAAVGAAVAGTRGGVLADAAAALALGASWPEAWAGADPRLEPVAQALRPSWEDGVAPAGTLRAVAATLRRERRVRAMEAAGRLGVRLVLPLGLCHLPAFVLVGLVPVLVSMTRGLA